MRKRRQMKRPAIPGKTRPGTIPSAEGRRSDRQQHGEGDHEDRPGQQPLAERAVAQRGPLLLQPHPERRLAGDPALHLALDGLEVADQLLRVRVAVLGPLAQAAGHDPLERGRQVGPQRRHRPRLLEGDRVQRVEGGRAGEGQLAGDHLVEHDAEREDVAAVVDRLPAGLLRAHVAQGAEDEAGLGLGERLHVGDALRRPRGAVGSRSLARPKSRILAWPSGVTTMFSGLMSRWTMPASWAFCRPPADLARDLEGAQEVELAALDQGLDRLALDQLHRDEEALGPLVHVVDLGDRGVGDRGRRARLLEEAVLAVLVPRELRGQHLEGHRPAEAGVAGPVDDAHAALARAAPRPGSA